MRAAALAAGALLVAGSVLVTAAPAQAHNYLVSSTPSADEVLVALPDVFEVTTNGELLVIDGVTSGFAIEVRDGSGSYYGDGCVAVAGASLSTVAALGAAGEYTMLWQAVSADGHTVSGEIPFSWQPPADFVPAAGSDAPGDCNGTINAGGGSGETSAPRPAADLSTVLWIGGAVLAVLLASAVTFLILTRKRA